MQSVAIARLHMRRDSEFRIGWPPINQNDNYAPGVPKPFGVEADPMLA